MTFIFIGDNWWKDVGLRGNGSRGWGCRRLSGILVHKFNVGVVIYKCSSVFPFLHLDWSRSPLCSEYFLPSFFNLDSEARCEASLCAAAAGGEEPD